MLNNNKIDRTLRTVFTHDHYGPSSHQQTGLYAGLVIEPTGSVWKDPETGATMGTRALDGGPTSWQAVILETDPSLSHREFLFEFADSSSPMKPAQALTPTDVRFRIRMA